MRIIRSRESGIKIISIRCNVCLTRIVGLRGGHLGEWTQALILKIYCSLIVVQENLYLLKWKILGLTIQMV